MAFEFFPNVKMTTRLHPWPQAPEHFIDVKNDLTAKESQDVRSSGVPHVMGRAKDDDLTEDQRKEQEVKMGLNVGRMKLVRAASYIVGWSITKDGAPMVVNEHAIGALLPHVFEAIDKALDEHVKVVDAAKKLTEPATDSSSKSA